MRFHSDPGSWHHGARRVVLTALVVPILSLGALALYALSAHMTPSGKSLPVSGVTVHLPLASPQDSSAQAAAPDAASASTPDPAQAAPLEEAAATVDSTVHLRLLDGDETLDMTLEDYLWGVVSAEMPASFEDQALRAQAVAARTYTVYKLIHPTKAHEAHICSDPGCCQAWLSREDRMEKWGSDREALAQRISDAVRDTDGMVMCYGGDPIQAVFHAASGTATRSAEDVWGSEVPYLHSVTSPEGEEVPNYYSTATVSAADFAAALPECDLEGDCSSWIGETEYDESGLSRRISIGGTWVKTTKLRNLFSLRSSNLSITGEGDTLTFSVTGYGHGVGMSQYGANAMAKEGRSWQEIMEWYYSGAKAENLADKLPDMG